VQVGRGRVERLMAANGLVGAKRRGRACKTTVAEPAGCERPDLVNRDFTASRPDALWIADFTCLRSWWASDSSASCWTCSRGAAFGRQLSWNMRTDLVLDALKTALATRRHGADLEPCITPIAARRAVRRARSQGPANPAGRPHPVEEPVAATAHFSKGSHTS
jgi:putative transposase